MFYLLGNIFFGFISGNISAHEQAHITLQTLTKVFPFSTLYILKSGLSYIFNIYCIVGTTGKKVCFANVKIMVAEKNFKKHSHSYHYK